MVYCNNLTIDLKMSIDVQRLTSKMSEERSKLSAGETLFTATSKPISCIVRSDGCCTDPLPAIAGISSAASLADAPAAASWDQLQASRGARGV